MGDDRLVNDVSGVLPFWSSLVESGNLVKLG